MSAPSKPETFEDTEMKDIETEGSEPSPKLGSSLDIKPGDAPNSDAEPSKPCALVILFSLVIYAWFVGTASVFHSTQLQLVCALHACLPAIFLVHYTRGSFFQYDVIHKIFEIVAIILAWVMFFTSIVYIALAASNVQWYNPQLREQNTLILYASAVGLYSSLWHFWLIKKPQSPTKIQYALLTLSFIAIIAFFFIPVR